LTCTFPWGAPSSSDWSTVCGAARWDSAEKRGERERRSGKREGRRVVEVWVEGTSSRRGRRRWWRSMAAAGGRGFRVFRGGEKKCAAAGGVWRRVE